MSASDRCGACGTPLEPGAVFCAECGSRVSDRPGADAPVPAERSDEPDRSTSHAAADVAVPSPYGAMSSRPGPALPEPSVARPVPGPPVAEPVDPGRAAAAPASPIDASPTPAAPSGPPPLAWSTATAPWSVQPPADHGRLAVAPGAVAPVGRRVAAFALDALAVVVVLLVGYGVVVATGMAGTEDRSAAGGAAELGAGLLVVQGLVVLLGLGQWLAESFTGATIGSALLGIRTVSATTGRPAGLWRILLRQLVVGLGALVCFVGEWVVVASGAWDAGPAQRGWHDKAAGTLVLRAAALGTAVPSDPAGAYASAVARAVAPLGAPSTTLPVPAPPAGGVPPAAPVAAEPAAAPPPPPVPPRAPVAVPPATVDPEAIPRVEPIPVPTFARDVAAVRPASGVPAEGLITGPPVSSTRVAGTPGAPSPAGPAAAPALDHELADPAAAGLGDLEHTRLRPAPLSFATDARVGAGLRLVFDTGERVEVRGEGLVGRNPDADGVAHVVAIDDPDRSVSKTHLAFGLDGATDRLWVADRGSTNGTVLVRPDGSRLALPIGARASVTAGWQIRFGERTARVEAR